MCFRFRFPSLLLTKDLMRRDLPVPFRIPMLMAGFVCLAFGIGVGLSKLGWNVPFPVVRLAAFHGPLMVCGFFGTVIALERAVAIGQRWAYLGPLSAAIGGLALVAGFPWGVGGGLMIVASGVFTMATASIFLRQRAMFTLTLLLGALSWLLGNLLWLGGMDIVQVIPWWLGFLVLTIAGERLELSRFLPPSKAGKIVFSIIVAAFLMGAATATLGGAGDMRMLSAALAALALWLMRQDSARHTIKQDGLTRFIAACLLSGYVWLLAGALVGIFAQPLLPGSTYDAFLHAILVGFVFSMVFGHAPIIFPAVAKVKIPYHPMFYLPLFALHSALLVRFVGDVFAIPGFRGVGGALNAVALLLFVVSTISAVIRGKRRNLT